MTAEFRNESVKAIADLGTQYREAIDAADRADTIHRVSSKIAKSGLGLVGLGVVGLVALGVDNKNTAPTFAYLATTGVVLSSVAATTSVFSKHAASAAEARAEDIALDQDITAFLAFGAGTAQFKEPGLSELE